MGSSRMSQCVVRPGTTKSPPSSLSPKQAQIPAKLNHNQHIMSYSVQSKKSGKTYFLHGRRQKLKGGQEVTLYFFAGEAKEGALDALPAGYEVSENASTGLPLLKKIR
jgi:hypothetical protein